MELWRAIKQWQFTSSLCEHAFILLIWKKKHDKWQISHGARVLKQLQTALILSVTFI
jgi:hypothetical protein